MFKGTKTIGTKNYKKEMPYLQKTDELGETTIRLRREMGELHRGREEGGGNE